MIQRYVYGSPLPTEAVVRDLPVLPGDPECLTVRKDASSVSFSMPLEPDDMIFGLGETVRGINKRGHVYRSWNSDDIMHTEDRQSLYSSHNFIVISGKKRTLGLFLDDPGEVIWDLGDTSMEEIVITSLNGDLSLYVITGDSPRSVSRELRGLIGKSYLPPFWAFGYIQSRWGYGSAEDMDSVVHEHRSRGIPIDGVCLDIDYMDQYRDFTWHPEKIPDLAGLVARMRRENIHLIPIIDAGIPDDPEDRACKEGLEHDAFVKREDGTLFRAAVWPGLCFFTDYLNSRARAWFGSLYRPLLEAGVDGFWNDMNEPSLFYSMEGINLAYSVADELRGKNLRVDDNWKLQGTFAAVANNRDDYKSFYHDMDGLRVRHDKVHNLYGYGMTRATMDGMHAFDPDHRFLLFSRSSYIGAHRYGGLWQGDNRSWWAHLKLNLQMLPGLNMCGFLFTGADLGGFGSDTTEDLLIRWLELGIFTPLMRNHSALHTREQEVYRFKSWENMKNIITVRYALLPYLYSEYLKAVHHDDLFFRALAFDYPDDEIACQTEDQVMLGNECMIAPVYVQNTSGRVVYLPEDMLLVRLRPYNDMDLVPMKKGHHWVDAGLHEALLFIRRGCCIPFASGKIESTVDIPDHPLYLIGWDPDEQGYTLCEDDGISYLEGTERTLKPSDPALKDSVIIRGDVQ